MRRTLSGIAALATIALLAGCASPGTSPEAVPEPTESAHELSGTINIAAAASLQPAFEQLAQDFTEANPKVTVDQLTFDGSSVLATQILAGAPIDVFASADEANMIKVSDAGLVAADPLPFATSSLEIAVTPGNPLGIASLADLAPGNTQPVVVICASEVPCGAASHKLLDRDGVTLTPASEEQNVTAVLTKVSSGEADAGLVYRSDVLRSDGAVEGIEIPDSAEAAGSYMIAPLSRSKSPEAAAAFAEFLTSAPAQQLLAKLGFGPA